MLDAQTLLNKIEGVKILVAGDLMLDSFIYGDADRLSPESPVPVLSVREETTMLGGAGNVVANLAALKAKPVVFAVTGADSAADKIEEIAHRLGADIAGVIKDDSRPTTIKTRYLVKHQHLLRSDIEKTHPLSASIEADILKRIESRIGDVKAVILSDYGKGFLTKTLLQSIIKLANKAGIPVLVDPKGYDFSRYSGADIVTPNRKELGEASGMKNLKTDDEIISAAQKVIADNGIKNVVATRSEDGMSIVCSSGKQTHLKTRALEVFDVSGAGDTVISTLAAVMAVGSSLEEAAQFANIAAGISVSKVGTTPVRPQEILDSLDGRNTGTSFQARIADIDSAIEQIRKWKAQGLKVGMTCGCFDIIHYGHVNYLNEARQKCDRLIVALNHDVSVKILKGPTRPVNDEIARATVLGALASVDMTVFFGAMKAGEDNTPCGLIDGLRPDIFFKGGDYTVESLPETRVIHAYGGEVLIMPMYQGYSTTNIIEKSRAAG